MDAAPISRQRRWQIKQRARGSCAKCGKPATQSLCEPHLQRERQKSNDRYSAAHPNVRRQSHRCAVCGEAGHNAARHRARETAVAA